MDRSPRLFDVLGGDWVDADERFEIRRPATEELVASVARGGREHADGRWRHTPQRSKLPCSTR